jgi:hypothetical protein
VRIVVTSIIREAGLDEGSGRVRVIDWDRREVLANWSLPDGDYRKVDPNPRGGLRGARGVSAIGNRLVVANTERLFIFDEHWQMISSFSSPLMGSLHEILAEQDGIWCCCTYADLMVKWTWDGLVKSIFSWREEKNVVRALGFTNLKKTDLFIDYRDPNNRSNIAQLNGIFPMGQYGYLLSMGQVPTKNYLKKCMATPGAQPEMGEGDAFRSYVLWVGPAGKRLPMRIDGISSPSHNVAFDGERLITLDTSRGEIRAGFDDEHRSFITRPVRESFGYLRGLCRISKERYLVGDKSPMQIHEIDAESLARVGGMDIPGPHRDECVFAIAALPSCFEEPPATLISEIVAAEGLKIAA